MGVPKARPLFTNILPDFRHIFCPNMLIFENFPSTDMSARIEATMQEVLLESPPQNDESFPPRKLTSLSITVVSSLKKFEEKNSLVWSLQSSTWKKA